MTIQPKAAVRIVAAMQASYGMPAAFRIAGLTMIMYAIEMKVTIPAVTSLRMVVLCSGIAKNLLTYPAIIDSREVRA
jgi:hypothetical protein